MIIHYNEKDLFIPDFKMIRQISLIFLFFWYFKTLIRFDIILVWRENDCYTFLWMNNFSLSVPIFNSRSPISYDIWILLATLFKVFTLYKSFMILYWWAFCNVSIGKEPTHLEFGDFLSKMLVFLCTDVTKFILIFG